MAKVTNLDELKQALYDDFNEARECISCTGIVRRSGYEPAGSYMQAVAQLAGKIIDVEKELRAREEAGPQPLVGKKPAGPQGCI